MSTAHVVAMIALAVAVVGAAGAVPAAWSTGLAVAITQLVVAETHDEGLRGLYAFLSVPVVLTVAILTAT